MNQPEEFILITWTCGSLDEARHVSRYLVQSRLVACANIIPWVESVFLWNNQLDTSQETKVIFKTVKGCFNEVKKVILEHAKYEVPEILQLPIEDGNKGYLDWIVDSVTQH